MLGVGVARQLRVAVQQGAAVEWGEQPLVRVDDEAVGLLDAVEQVAHGGRRQRCAPVGAVDVHPQPVLLADGGDPGQVVDDPQVGGAGGGNDCEHAVGALRAEGLGQRVAGHPPALVTRHPEHIRVHHLLEGVDHRRMRLGGDGCPQPLGAMAAESLQHGVAGRHQRGQVAQRSTGDEAAAGGRRQARQVGHPAQCLVLRVHGAGALQPAPAVDRRCADQEVEDRRLLGGCARDERQVPGVVDRHGRGRQDVRPDPQGRLAAQSLRRDRRAGAPGQLVRRAGDRRAVPPSAAGRERPP